MKRHGACVANRRNTKDVYGESCDKIIQGNTSDIIFLKSTDDSLIETLQTMSGKTHRVYLEQKAVTRAIGRLWLNNEDKVTYTPTLKEVPVIMYNDMAFIGERNSIVLRAGDSPIWNKNETILPMSWRLFQNTIKVPGKEFSLQTIPSTSSVLEFDVKNNQPDFTKMLEKRMALSYEVDSVMEQYKEAFGYTDDHISRMNRDVYSDDIMKILTESMRRKAERDREYTEIGDDFGGDIFDGIYGGAKNHYEENTEVLDAVKEKSKEKALFDAKIYAGKQLSRSDIKDATENMKYVLIRAYHKTRQYFEQDNRNFKVIDGSLFGIGGDEPVEFIRYDISDYEKFMEAAKEKDLRVYGKGDGPADKDVDSASMQLAAYTILDPFLSFLISQPSWSFAKGYFEDEVAKILHDEKEGIEES